jgi:uroporphyrin-III C-methyltransferase
MPAARRISGGDRERDDDGDNEDRHGGGPVASGSECRPATVARHAGGPERTAHYRANPRALRAGAHRLLESNVNSSPPLMSDPNDRRSAPAGHEPDAPAATATIGEPPPEHVVVEPRRGRRVSLGMLAGVGVLGVAAAALFWQDGRRTQQALRMEVAQRLTAIESATQVAARAQTQLATDLRDAQAKVTLLEARLAESQAEQAALEALYRDLAPSRDEIAISEIEQVLLVASQQLQLAGNVPSALTALQLADTKLQRLDRPQFVPLRRALSRDMDRLKAVPYVDIVGMSLKLDQGLAAVDTLPLAMDERVPAPPPSPEKASPADVSPWRSFLREMWSDVKQLVRIEIADRPAAPLVPAQQQYFLRENLKLRLLTARIALLARNDASFEADLTAVDAWLKQYFDTRAKAVQTLQATVRQLAASPMPGETPDLSRSLEALRVLRLSQDRAPGRGAAAAR